MNSIPEAPDASRAPAPGLLRRLAAIFYDLLLLLAMLFVASGLALLINGGQPIQSGNPFYTLYMLLVTFLFYAWFWVHGGQTLGMRAWRIRVLRDDGQPLTWGDATRRFLFAVLSLIPFGLGFLWSLFDKEGRAWHDRLSRTRLILVPA
ncbi:MAG: RDD family protein [Gammaproteobacteria bacterium]|nr:RDD family protein [Gammaproteobacteria bacterium]MBU1654395.1 RDD family protein [Gammaproteobacteria bacterium]MBU1960236.1 RDD family protein [Gammaproteobacteria bacterium]